MDLNTFSDQLDRNGAEMDGWPADLREAALRLLDDSAEARRLLEAARRTEELLEGMSVVTAPAELASRIINELPEDAWQKVMNWFAAALWRPALAGALALTLGFLVGIYQEDPLDQMLADELSLLAFSDTFEDLPYEY